ncbi:chromosome segregation protein [Maioricimonas rarisocia]|uniref:Chromosome segregation protein n=1 Tax=Maioricimonas rarisocia TaxID=2528026 RepID=A0A517Z3B7_9PLAN|nr:YhaN family protein [Maioricimonas rarisocia]QDU36965.1 chromosome segregation protein [Maioricimonas rarisocia]
MKIAELKLIAFGPFTDQTLDLSAGAEGLHVIHGPNEAGKSSTLRAIRDLLFGIPSRSDDNFLHAYPKMRLGGTLANRQGERLEFVRRKGNKGTLRDGEDRGQIGDDALLPFIGTVGENLFETLFGIDYDRLHAGGQEILAEGGEIGKLLFSAGGVGNLKQHEADLQERLDDLYKAGGKKQVVSELLRDLREKQKELRELQLSADVWTTHEQNLREAEKRYGQLDAELRERRGERDRLDRFRAALPSISRWRQACESLDDLGEGPLLPDDFGERRDHVLPALALAESRQQEANTRLSQIVEELGDLDVSDDLLAEHELIGGLQKKLGRYDSAMQDRPGLSNKRETADELARELLRDLGREPDLAQIDSLRIPTTQRTRIHELASESGSLVERLKVARSTVQELTGELARAEEELKDLGQPGDAGEIRAAVQQVLQRGNLEEQRDEIRQDVQQRQSDADVLLAQLPLWKGTIEECERLAVPAEETIERFDAEFRSLESERVQLRSRQEEVEGELQRLQTELDRLEGGGEIPTEQELEEARQQRDRGWRLILQEWQQKEADESAKEWLSRYPGIDDLAEAYRVSVAGADDLADRLRREADRVAEKQQLSSQRSRLEDQLKELEAKLGEVGDRLEQKEEEWKNQWQPLGIVPRTPPEMRSWRSQQQELSRHCAELRATRSRMAELEEVIDAARSSLIQVLSAAGLGDGSDGMSLRELLQRCQSRLEEIDQQTNEFDRLMERQEDVRRRLEKAGREEETAESELKAWRDQWAKAIEPLGLEAEASARQVTEMLEQVNRLFDQFNDSRSFASRIEEIDRFVEQFEQEVRGIANRLAPEIAEQPVVEIAALLNRSLQEATRLEQQRNTLRSEQEKTQQRLNAATEEIRTLRAELDQLRELAGCSSSDDLQDVWQTFLERRELKGKQSAAEDQLRQFSGGLTVEEFVAAAEQENPDELGHRIEELDRQIRTLQAELEQVITRIADEKNALKQWGGSDAAAEAAEQCQQTIAALEEKVREFAVVHVASRVLSVGMEQYRKRNQGPILGRASELFARLTLGSFSELRPDTNDKGEPILTGVRGDGKVALPVEAMSDGTHDQLFLALRIASVENWNSHHEPMPFVVDDILLSFDDDRARAALGVLAELSQTTQVLFFTHHQHLVDLAREAVEGSQLFVHSLNGAGVAV